MYREALGDVFRIRSESIAHCITGDYSLGAGLAKDLDVEYGLKAKLMNMGTGTSPDCLAVTEGDITIFNLVTKQTRWDKATYDNLEESIIKMKQKMRDLGISTVYVPQLGCGKDKLKWEIVKEILKRQFEKEKDLSICVLFYMPPKT